MRTRAMHSRAAHALQRAVSLLLSLIALAPMSVAQGQQTRLTRIIDERDRPVVSAQVDVEIDGQKYSQRTDTAGVAAFPVNGRDLRAYLSVRAVGYAPWSGTVTWRDDAGPVVVRILSAAQSLSEVTVRDRSPAVIRLNAVDQRIAHGTPNAAVTRAAIDKRNPVALSQMLRGIAGLRLADSLGATVAISTRGAKMERLRPVDCVMRISIDGVVLSASMDINQVPPVDVHAIEVYFGPARIPPEFGGMRADAWCGLIAIWTRSG